MLVLLVNAVPTGSVSWAEQTAPPDTIRQDSTQQDTVVVPSRGRVMSPRRDYSKKRFTYINPLDSIQHARDSLAQLHISVRPVEGVEPVQAADSLAALAADTLQPAPVPVADSIAQDSLLPALPDAQSLRGFRKEDDTLHVDTVATQQKTSSNALDFPVLFEAKDSTVYLPNEGYAHFYGEGKVDYQEIELRSQVISMNMDSSVVHAHGIADSLGVIQGKPVFKEGSTEYTSETMSYNFKSKKGYITNVDTKQGEGYLTSERSKKGANDELFLEHGRYTTCDVEHPHFYIALSRAKVRPKKDVVFGPAWLVIEDVPLPFAIPFGFFPFNSSYSSGFIMPSYGEDSQRGFYLREGGYYFAISDQMDLKATGEIYTKGSWGLSVASNYNRRYKYRGNFSADYQVFVQGEKNMPDYSKTNNFRIRWSHSQDSKASPNSTFSASVNFSTTSYDKSSMSSLYDPTQYAQSTKTSSVSYSRTFPGLAGLSISASTNVSMSSRDSTISMTLPSMSISLPTIYPFKRKKAVGKERWYEKINLSYSGNLDNRITTKESQFFEKNLFRDWSNGMTHKIPIKASFSVLKYINITPSFNYTERWSGFKEMRHWDEARQTEVRDTIRGFNRVYNWDLSFSATTKLYGFYKPMKFLGDKVQMIRHVLTPTVSYSYAPDFSSASYGFYETYLKTDAQGNVSTVQYSPYSATLAGAPSAGRTGSISMSLSNNLEMKMKSEKDSTGFKKVSLIDELTASMSYNMAAITKPWSNLNMNMRIKITPKYTFNMNAVFNTYAYSVDEKTGNIYEGNETEWSRGKFGRFQGMSQHLSYTLNNDTYKKLVGLFSKKKKTEQAEEAEEESGTNKDAKSADKKDKKEAATLDADGYMKFKMPWSLSISYSVTMAEDRTKEKFNYETMRYPYKLTHTLNFSGNLKLTNTWDINFTSGYDFTQNKLSTTTINIQRDLHCFNLSGGMVLSSYGRTSFHFTIRATSQMLTDALKWDKRNAANNNVQWY